MAKLKLGAIADDKSVKLTVELPAAVHRDLLAYAEVLAREVEAFRDNLFASDPGPLVARIAALRRALGFNESRALPVGLARRGGR